MCTGGADEIIGPYFFEDIAENAVSVNDVRYLIVLTSFLTKLTI